MITANIYHVEKRRLHTRVHARVQEEVLCDELTLRRRDGACLVVVLICRVCWCLGTWARRSVDFRGEIHVLAQTNTP